MLGHVTAGSCDFCLLQHEHPYISAMINNGTLSYDHDRDGTHSQVAGCHSKFRKRKHDTYVIISYIDQVLSVRMITFSGTHLHVSNMWSF